MGSQEGISVPVIIKLNKISSYLSSFQADKVHFKRNSLSRENEDEQQEGNSSIEGSRVTLPQQQNDSVPTHPPPTSDKINAYYSSDVKELTKQPLHNIHHRIKTFGDLGWLLPINILSVYECTRRGWYLQQHDMLCCCCCNQMICLHLPALHSSSYEHAVSVLRDRVLSKHSGNCRYLRCPEPVAACRPPALLTTPHLYSLAAAAHQFTRLVSSEGEGTGLPYLENGGKDVMDRLGVSSSVVQEVWGSVCENQWQQVAVLLVLCGWKATNTPDTIRCELCQRSIGLWHFLSYAEHQQREDAVAASASMEIDQPTAATMDEDDGTQNPQPMTGDTKDPSQGSVDSNSAAKSGEELLVCEPAENEDGNVNRSNVKESDTTENGQSGEDVDASKDQSQGERTNKNLESIQEPIANEGETDTSTRREEIAETGNKRRRSECEDESSGEDQSVAAPVAGLEDTQPSKRSKINEEDIQSADVSESSAATIGICGENKKGLQLADSSPATIGVSGEKSPTSSIPQVPSKPVFCPFSQHRFWCSWITSASDNFPTSVAKNSPSNGCSATGGLSHSISAGDSVSGAHGADRAGCGNGALDALPGYAVFTAQLKTVLQLAQKKQWTTSDKYCNTIDGLRSVRAHLNSWAK